MPCVLALFDGIAAVPAACDALFAGGGFYGSRDWYRTIEATAMPAGAVARYFVAGRPEPVAVFPMLEMAGTLSSLTTPYSCSYQPLVAPDVDGDGLRAAGCAFARATRRYGTVRIDALDADWAGLGPLLEGARDGGLLAQRFDHFGNWHQPVAGMSWAAYQEARTGVLRETIRRKLRKAERDDTVSFRCLKVGEALEEAIAAYEDVYARSWKDPEPYPHFTAALIRMAAARGALRLGVLRSAGRPVAVQLWIVADGAASVLKLAHDEAYKPLSPGTVLTALMIRGLLDEEHVGELDFGRGDDDYKRLWVSERRQRIGVVLANPLRPSGAAAIGRHVLGVARRRGSKLASDLRAG